MIRCGKTLLTIGVLSAMAASASAQSLTARASTLHYAYVYGAGGDAHSDDVTIPDNAALAADAVSAAGSGSTSGVLTNGQPYSAGVGFSLSHEYTISGPLNAFTSITASGRSQVAASATGAGVAVMHAVNPGNELMFAFTLVDARDYRLTGLVDIPAPNFFSSILLQKWDGITWQPVYHTAFLPDGEGPFDHSGTLVAGDYRLISALSKSAQANQSWDNSYNYTFTIPEPVSVGLLAIGMLFARRQRGGTSW